MTDNSGCNCYQASDPPEFSSEAATVNRIPAALKLAV